MRSINFKGKTGTAGLDQSYGPLHFAQGPVVGMAADVVCTHTRWAPEDIELGMLFNGACLSVEWLGDGTIHPIRVLVDPEINGTPTRAWPPFEFVYRNYRGEITPRKVRPIAVWWGKTEWHPEDQWMLRAFDVEKEEPRDFAIRDIMFSAKIGGVEISAPGVTFFKGNVTPTEDGWHTGPQDAEEHVQDINILRHDGLAVGVAVHNGDLTPQQVRQHADLMAAAPRMKKALILAWKAISGHGNQPTDAEVEMEKIFGELGIDPDGHS
ncbi:hypothetical protein CPT_Sansa99 [Caulobacter phage Sansa]|uniref:Uncharacterized protein n=1 Tax=Caulobacter phage Sansa TaxID=1675600 RepID=A0A0K1LMR8_9CAUD|nr:hypothetical protein HOR07_gp099 [Caulobacter phage Sansa]AKU43503.1 hypothetical protein CPT_Sansa99 [Caulobacter phage Sansa]